MSFSCDIFHNFDLFSYFSLHLFRAEAVRELFRDVIESSTFLNSFNRDFSENFRNSSSVFEIKKSASEKTPLHPRELFLRKEFLTELLCGMKSRSYLRNEYLATQGSTLKLSRDCLQFNDF